MSQIRLNKTPELKEALAFLRGKYHVLSEAEIIKIALAEKYAKELEQASDKGLHLKKVWEEIKTEGQKLGDKLLTEKGLKREDMSEEDLYNLLKDV